MSGEIRVMLVDDEIAFTAILAKRLTHRGLAVVAASGSDEAYCLLEQEDVDVVVLDYVMPGIDGLQFCKIVRQRFDGVEVILLSGRAGINEAVEALGAGAFDCLPKGTSVDTLEQRILDATQNV